MFALTDAFLLRELPYPDPEELVLIQLDGTRGQLPSAIPTLTDYQARTDLFTGVAAFRYAGVIRLRLPSHAVALDAVEVSTNLLQLLSPPRPAVRHSDDAEMQVALTSAAARRIAGAASLVGHAFRATGERVARVVQVLDDEFVFPRVRQPHALKSVSVGPLMEFRDTQGLSSNNYTVLARLRRGVAPDAAAAALSTRGVTARVEPLRERLVGPNQRVALGGILAGLFVLLLCAANYCNLALAQGVYRVREFALRQAVGASRRALVRLGLIEAAIAAGAGTGGGLLIGQMILALLAGTIPADYKLLTETTLTLRAIVFCAFASMAIASVGTALVLSAGLSGGRSLLSGSSAEPRRLGVMRKGIAALQVAVAIVLSTGAVLVLRSHLKLITQPAGMDTDTIVMPVSFPPEESAAAVQADLNEMLDRLSRVPGVAEAAAAVGPMLDGARRSQIVRADAKIGFVSVKSVTPSFFTAMGTRLIAGRAFTAADRRGEVVVVNDAFARQWRLTQPVGSAVVLGRDLRTVVGVAENAFDIALDRAPEPTLFVPWQEPRPGQVVNLLVRPGGETPAFDHLRQIPRSVNPDVVEVDVTRLGDRLGVTIQDRTLAAVTLALFAISSAAVCCAGLGGLVAFFVARRARELAIRLSLGAAPRHVIGASLREAALAAAMGGACGLALSFWLSRFLQRFMFGVEATDPATLLGTAAVLVAFVALVALLPARRALRLNPADVLRRE